MTLKEARRALGHTQAQAAVAADVSAPVWSEVERAEQGVDKTRAPETVRKLDEYRARAEKREDDGE